MNRGSITLDLKAQITGYEASLRQLQEAAKKIDLGSDIGKKISSAISQVESQIKTLSKNLTPRASSDTQIDTIIERSNRAGEALQNVVALMQQVEGKDLNLGTLGEEINTLKNQIDSLQEKLNLSKNIGIQTAVKDSEELKEVFESLGLSVEQINTNNGLKTLQSGLASATKEADKAQEALGKITDRLEQQQKAYGKKYDNNPFANGKFNKDDFVTRLNAIKEPDKIIDKDKVNQIQQQMLEGLTHLNLDVNQQGIAVNLLDQLFEGLDKTNISGKIKTFIEQFKEQLNVSPDDVKAYVLNKQTDKSLLNSLLGIDEAAMIETRNKLYNMLQEIAAGLDLNKVAQIKTLIDTDSIEQAKSTTIREMHKANEEIIKRQKEDEEKLVETLAQEESAKENKRNADNKVETINSAIKIYTEKIITLESTVKQQEEQITQLRIQLENLLHGQASQIKNNSSNVGDSTQQLELNAEAATEYKTELERVQAKEQLIGKIQGVAQRWFSIYAVVRMVSNAIRTVISTIRELDKTITEIAIVTKMDQNTLWGQMGSYIELADKYAASISGVYKVSQLYYQQGLQQADVMALTEQTLKMARISGLDYAEATDYMTNAVRSFKLEMQDAQVVVDTYSAVAASSATSVTELASAMSKTASSAQAVGASLQNTTAMLAVMIEATRESPENIGSAMKSIISRYGELKENKTGIDAEGEEYSLNKVDKALQSIGVSIHDVNGEFRDFDDVIFELAEKWDTVDKNTQRYIATVMAGNRQQSRFLALVSSNQRLQEESQIANNSEDAAQLQYLKVLDGIEAKVQNLQNALQSLYLNSGFETAYKNLIDFGTGIIKVFSSMTTIAKQPIPAIIAIGTTFYNVANVFTTVFDIIKTKLRVKAEYIQAAMTSTAQKGMIDRISIEQQEAQQFEAYLERIKIKYELNEQAMLEIRKRYAAQRSNVPEGTGLSAGLETGGTSSGLRGLFKSSGTKNMMASAGLSIGSLVLTSLSGLAQQNNNKQLAGGLSIGSSALSGASIGMMVGHPVIGALLGGALGFIQNLGNIFQSAEEKLKELQEEAEKANNEYLQKKSSTNDLNTQIKQLKELEKHRYDSIEAEEAYNEAANKMGDTYSNLISSVDEAGNVTIDLIAAENELSKSREEAIGAARKAAIANYKVAKQAEKNETAEAKQYRNITGDELREKAKEEVQRQAIQEYVFDVKEQVRQELLQELGEGESLDEEDIELNWRVTSINEDKIIQALKTRDVSDLTGEELKAYAYAATGQRYDEQSQKFKQTHTKAPSYFQSGKIQDIYPHVEDSILKKFLMAYDQSPSEVPFELIKQAQNIEKENLSKNDQIIYASVQSLIQDYGKSYADINQAKAKTASVMKSDIAKIVGLEAIGSDKSFQQELINSSGILTEMAMSKLLEEYGSNGITDVEYEDFIGNEDTAGQLETLLQEWNEDLEKLWSNLTTSKKEEINNLLKNAKKYSETQLKAELANYGFGEEDPITKAIISSAQENAYTVEKLSNKMQNRSKKLSNKTIIEVIDSNTLEQNYGGYELESLADLQDQIDTYVEAGKLTVSNANKFMDNYAAILAGIGNIKDSELREAAQAKIFSNTDWSISGIYELTESLKNIGISSKVIEQVQGLSEFVPKNFIADMESFADGVASKFEDFQKVLSNGLKGMDLKDAMKVADKLGVSISEFKFEDSKFYFTQDITPEQVEKAYLNWNKDLQESLNKDYEALIGANGLIKENGTNITLVADLINRNKDTWDSFSSKDEKVQFLAERPSLHMSSENIEKAIDLYDQFYSGYEALTEEEKESLTFNAYVYQELSKSWDNAKAALNAATDYEVNAFLIQTGNINTFSEYISKKLEGGFQDEEEDLLKKAIQSGNLESLQGTRLWPYVQEYVKVVDDTFSNIQKELGESLLDSFQGGKKTIEVTAENLAILQQNKGLFKSITKTAAGLDSTTENIQIGDILTFEDISEFQKDQSSIYNYINTAATTTKDRLEWLSKTYEAIYSNGLDVTSSWLESGKVNIKDFGNLLINRGEIEEGASAKEIDEKIKKRAEDYGLKLSQVTGQYFIENYDAYILQLENDLEKLTSENSSLEERNETRAKIETARKRQETERKKATEDVIKSYQNISIEQREAFATAFGKEFSNGQIEKIFGQIQNDGTYKLDVQELRNLLNSDTISVETRAYIEELITGIADDYLSAISTASDYITKGTTKQADMQKFVNDFNKLTTKKISVGDAFQYDTLLNQFTLKNNIFTEYIEAQRIELEKLGMSGDAIDEYIKDQTQTILQQSMDITSILSDADKFTQSKSINSLKNQLINWIKTKGTPLTDKGVESYANSLIKRLYKGGTTAVNLLKKIKGDEVTSEEINAVYRAAMDRLNEASDQLTRGIGETVIGSAAAIIKSIKPDALEELDDGTYVIKSTFDLVAAYNMLYKSMEATNVATTTELNSTYAKMLTAHDQPEIDAISTLNDAMGMTYEALGEMLSRYSIKLADVMSNSEEWGLQSLGNGKVQIYDFKTFASQMHWNPDSEEYLSAFSTYNDALIELNGKTEKAILDEVKNLSDAKIGDKINLTYLENAIIKTYPGLSRQVQEGLEYDFYQLGAKYKDGILTLNANANIFGIINKVKDYAEKYGDLLPDQLAELADVVSNYIDNIISLIKNGISGNLKNVDAQKLQSWADQFHLNLDFTQTAEGLKLSQESAIKLYNALSSIDNIKAKLVFNELNSSLKESNEHYKSISSIMQHIVELNKLIEETQNKINEENKERSEVKIQQYKEELALAQEILAVRSTSEDEGFSFMSNKIPGAQNNPINYFNNWASAIQKLQEAMKTSSKTSDGITHKGLIDYQDWYNIATEMGNMAKVTGNEFELAGITIDGSLEKTAALIEKGASALTVDSTGNLKVALGDIGINFEAGAGAMSDGIDTGIKEMARSQVEMLNGLIAMLELIVSMEQLGDIDVDENGISFDELFEFDETGAIKGFSQGYQNWINYVTKEIQNGNKDLENALKGISFGDYSLLDMLGWTTSDFEEKATKEIQQLYPALLQALKTAAESGEWNLDNIGQSLVDILKQSGFDGTIPLDIGDTTLLISGNTTTTINWQDKDVQNILKQIDQDTEKARKKAKNWLQAYSNGEGLSEEELTYVLALNGNIKYDIDGNVTGITVNGETYSAEGEEFSPAKYAQALVDAGIDFDTDKAIKEAAADGKKSISVPVEMGLQTDVYVTSDENGIEWHYDGGIFKTKQAMLDSAWEYYAGHRGIDASDQKAKNKYLWEEWGVREHITAKVTGKNGVEIDTATDASAREAIENKISNLTAKDLELDDTGNLNIDLGNDMHISLSGDVVVDENGNPVEAKVIEQLKKKLNIDLQLADTIKVGVTAALTELPDIKFDANTQAALDKINTLKDAAKEINSDLKLGTNEVNTSITTNKTTAISNPAKQNIKVGTNEVPPRIDSNKTYATNNPAVQNVTTNGGGVATGNIGLAKAQGTLMGELGPELYVQNGRYFVAGQNGPEFVDLAPDAIVFNHLQTRSLLDKGMSPGRGKAVTNERNAVSYAKGNVNGGPAMASASAALAALRQLRAQWKALMDLGVADLAGKGGGGGGGGDKDLPGFIRDVERWYNWLQKIADLEKQITYQEQLRSKIQSDMVSSGKAYYISQKQTYEDARNSALTSQSLFLSQKESFNKRREQLNNSPLSELYTFDETGQLHYQEGSFNWLAQLFKTDDFGQLALNPQQQYEMILSRNPEFAQYMKYNSEGKEIKQEDYQDNKDQYYLDMVKAFSDRMDAEKEEMQNLFDSWNDQQKAVLEQMQKMNEQLQAMKDNQKEIEEDVLGAIVESRERQIKELQNTKDALQKSNQDFIDGLSQQLDKEQKMYQNNESDQELQRNRRQLAILQRSGGSAAQIASLQKQIEQQSRDQYFEKQQEQIDAVKEASDLQIERLDHQIEIEQEALEYQKANGLLWGEVYNVMKGTQNEIANFVTGNTVNFWSKSPLATTEDANKLIFKAEQWTQFRDDTKMQKAAMGRIDQNLEIFLAALEQIYGDQANWEEIKAKATEDYNKYYGIDNNDPNKAAWDSYPGKNDIETKNTGKQTTGTTNTTTTTTNTPNKTTNDEIDRNTISKSWYYDDVKHWKTAYTKDGRKIRVLEDKHVKDKGVSDGNRLHYKCKICGCDMGFIYEGMAEGLNKNAVDNGIANKSQEYNKISRLKSSVKNNNSDIEIIPLGKGVPKAANGAIVDQSGAAIIHDNEVILTAEQTKFLRDNILSNKSTSLLGILSSLHSSYKDISANTINSSEGNVIIENATVQMNVQKIADDYDARRAGDQAMEEMLRIARKSGTRSV